MKDKKTRWSAPRRTVLANGILLEWDEECVAQFIQSKPKDDKNELAN